MFKKKMNKTATKVAKKEGWKIKNTLFYAQGVKNEGVSLKKVTF